MKFKSYKDFLDYIQKVETIAVNGKFVDANAKITMEKRGDDWYINGHKIVPSLEKMFIILRSLWLTEYSFFEEYDAYQDWKSTQEVQAFQREKAFGVVAKVLRDRKWSTAHIHRKIQWMRVHFRNGSFEDIVEHSKTAKN